MRGLLCVIPLLFLIVSCSTRTQMIEVPVETVKTEYITNLQRDSIFIRDSIDRYQSNDTVYTTKYRYIYKQINKTDTVIRTDTVPKVITVDKIEVQEVNKIKWWLNVLIYTGLIALICAFVFLYIKLKPLLSKLV